MTQIVKYKYDEKLISLLKILIVLLVQTNNIFTLEVKEDGHRKSRETNSRENGRVKMKNK